MGFACSIPSLIDANYFKKVRFEYNKQLLKRDSTAKIHFDGFSSDIELEKLAFPKKGTVSYRIWYKEKTGELIENIYPDHRCLTNEIVIKTKITEKKLFEFMDETLPYFGISHYGFLPGKKQNSQEGIDLLTKILKNEKKLRYENEFYIEESGGKFFIQTSHNGFYSFRTNKDYTLNEITEKWLFSENEKSLNAVKIALDAIEKERIRIAVN